MIGCPALSGADGLATALAAIDCRTGQATAFAFGRLFGVDGRFGAALTLLLTLYIALFAIALLTGRSRIGLATLTPRMLTLGLVLTFATSWAAYQQTIWTLTTQGPDEIASVVSGTRGSATAAFADRMDALFAAVADSAEAAARPQPPGETGVSPAAPTVGGFNASTILTLSAGMLLLGSVGILVTAKIALAALLAIGPVFIVLALFAGTRGLFEGWLKATVLFALVPLLSVLIGGGAALALEPIASDLQNAGGTPEPRAVAVLFVGAFVFVALMVIALKTASTLVLGWRLPGARRERDATPAASPDAALPQREVRDGGIIQPVTGGPAGATASDDRVRGLVRTLSLAHPSGGDNPNAAGGRTREIVSHLTPESGGAGASGPAADRVRGVGSRFRTPQAAGAKLGGR